MDYYFDENSANRAINFIEKLCTHVKGKFAKQHMLLADWQKDIIRDVFGFKRPDGKRKYRIVYVEIPKKNGKSTLCSALGLYLTLGDREPGAEVYSAASSRDQAGIVFDPAKQMVLQSTHLSGVAHPYRNSIVKNNDPSFYKVLPADADVTQGINTHGAIFDELHVQPNRNLWDNLTTSTAGREQPLIFAITTAGVYDKTSICWELHEYTRKIKEGLIEDDTFYGVIYSADQDDPIDEPKTWEKANPNIGISPTYEYIREAAKKAVNEPSYENTFRRFHLNQWVGAESKWIGTDRWADCYEEFTENDLLGMDCWGGLDLAVTIDATAWVLIFPKDDKFYLMPYIWIPEENARERSEKDNIRYDLWINQGWMLSTPGNTTDYDFIETTIKQKLEIFRHRSTAYDRYNSSQIVNNLVNDNIDMLKFGQGYVSMSFPMKEFERLVLSGKMRHNGNPVMTWMLDNVVASMDPAGNIKPNKGNSKEKIDGIVAGIMALGCYLQDDHSGPSVYEERGVLSF